MYEAGYPKVVLCDNLEGWSGERRERGFQDGGNTSMPMANSY